MFLIRRVLLILIFSAGCFGQNSFFSDRAVALNPISNSLVPLSYGQVRVCTSQTSVSPCPNLATVFDAVTGGQLTVGPSDFGQVTTDFLGRFSFQATPGNYFLQVAGAASNTPQISYTVSLSTTSVSGAQIVNGNNIFTGQNTFNANTLFKGPDPYLNIMAYGGVGNSSTTNTAVLNTAASAAALSGGGNTISFPASTAGGFLFSTRPAIFTTGLNLTCSNTRGAAFGFGGILEPDYSESTSGNGFLTWTGTPTGGDGGGVQGCVIFKNSGTGGSALAFTGTDSNNRSGHIFLQNDRISGSGTFAHCIYVDGSLITTVGTQGVRDIIGNGVECFQTTTDSVFLNNAAHFFLSNFISSPTAGTADVNITGASGSTSTSQAIFLANAEIGGSVNLDFVNNFTCAGCTATNNYSTTVNTTSANYFGNVNGNVTLNGSGGFFGSVGGTITSGGPLAFYFTNLGAFTNGPIKSNTQIAVGSTNANCTVAGEMCEGTGTTTATHFLGTDGNAVIRRNNGSGAGTNYCFSFDGVATCPFNFDNVNGFSTSKPITLGSTVVASLPSASTPFQQIGVTDSTAVAAEGQTCVGGSSNKAIAISNGSVWKCF